MLTDRKRLRGRAGKAVDPGRWVRAQIGECEVREHKRAGRKGCEMEEKDEKDKGSFLGVHTCK